MSRQTTLDERIARAEQEIARWSEEKRQGMQLQGVDPYAVRFAPSDEHRQHRDQTQYSGSRGDIPRKS